MALIEQFSRMLRSGKPTVSLTQSLEAVRVCLGAAQARRSGGEVALADLSSTAGFDGHAFILEYRRSKYPPG